MEIDTRPLDVTNMLQDVDAKDWCRDMKMSLKTACHELLKISGKMQCNAMECKRFRSYQTRSDLIIIQPTHPRHHPLGRRGWPPSRCSSPPGWSTPCHHPPGAWRSPPLTQPRARPPPTASHTNYKKRRPSWKCNKSSLHRQYSTAGSWRQAANLTNTWAELNSRHNCMGEESRWGCLT